MSDPYGSFYAAFLTDHPEALAGVTVVGGELFMNIETLRRFITWCLANGLVGDEEKALAMLERLPELEAQARAAHRES
jgi:hypothetical protein